MKRRVSRKGVSPLIATVLLIAFAVALGAVVMNWGRGYVVDTQNRVRETGETDVKCSSDVRLKIGKIANTLQFCYGGGGSSGYVNVVVVNDGIVDIDSLRFSVIGALGVYTNNSVNATSLSQSEPKRINLSYDYSLYGTIRQVRITPVINVGGVLKPCSGNALEKDTTEIINCSSA